MLVVFWTVSNLRGSGPRLSSATFSCHSPNSSCTTQSRRTGCLRVPFLPSLALSLQVSGPSLGPFPSSLWFSQPEKHASLLASI